jgi:hypothetical protein
MSATHHFLPRLSVLLIVLLTTCGCALFNPHYHSDARDKAKESTETATGNGLDNAKNATKTATTMATAVKYADLTISDYRKGMGYQAYLSSFTGVTLIPLAAVTIALGIQGGHTNSVTNLALGGAAVYGGSSWLSSPNRSLIYSAGIQAVNCAKMVMLPYSVDQTWMSNFNTNLNLLTSLGADLTIRRDNLQKSSESDDSEAQVLVDNATDLLKSTAVTRQNGYALKRRLELAGQTLVFTVDRIDGEVGKALLSTVPNLEALSGIIAGMGPSADMFRQVSQKAEPGPEIKDFQNNLAKTKEGVRNAIIELAKAESIVRGAVDSFDHSIPESVLQQCGVSEKDIIKPIRILPGPKVTITPGVTSTVFLSGGSGKYVIAKTDDIKGLEVSQPVPLGETVRIETTTGINEKPETKILVKDTAGQTAIIEISIVPKPAKK